jgi:hypothetical protein
LKGYILVAGFLLGGVLGALARPSIDKIPPLMKTYKPSFEQSIKRGVSITDLMDVDEIT